MPPPDVGNTDKPQVVNKGKPEPMSNDQRQHQVALNYQPVADRHDEAHFADGSIRPHWDYVLNAIDQLGPDALGDRQRKAQRILRDDGATYTVYSQPENSRIWGLDPVPLIIDSEEWSSIELGLLERVELLNMLLADLYGDRSVIKSGIMPPELLYSHPGFLRPCTDVKLPLDHQLILHCADMVRDASGAFKVIGDRTQAPSGAGYALENRTVMSRVLPSLFRDSHVHRLALFFRSLRNKLHELAPNGGTPRIVLLTPGAYNETYFEHAYLANYLGFSLVQGSDLTVRDGYLWLKSLDGLKRVDVVLRRVDDYFCDPVELKNDSHLGVPGLLDVAREGRVVIANPLGSGVLENPAILRYIDAIGQHFLGHQPRLHSAQTWWCGDANDLSYVLAHFDQLIIKPCFRKPGTHSVIGADCSPQEKQLWLHRIAQHPMRYVAQEIVLPSYSPSFVDGALQSRATVMRSFAVASEANYSVMPGGLTRVSTHPDQLIVTNQTGSISKDTWIIASEPEKQLTLIGEVQAVSAARGDDRADLPSRVVENMFWLGRYAERAEAGMRLLRTVLIQLNDIEQLPPQANAALLRAVTHVTDTYPGFTEDKPELFDHPDDELMSVIIDHKRPGTIAANLFSMLSSAEEVKELLSADTQRIINDIRDELNVLETNLGFGLGSAPEEDLDPMVTALLALAGLSHESMVRGPAWRFMVMGRRLERALQTVTLIRSLLVTAVEKVDHNLLLEPILLSLEALITYRRRYHAQLNIANGLEIILLDQSNPRSLLYQIEQLRSHAGLLSDADHIRNLSRESRYILEASTMLQLCDLTELARVEPKTGTLSELDQLMARVQHLLTEMAAAIAERYFDHTEGPQPLIRSGWEDYL